MCLRVVYMNGVVLGGVQCLRVVYGAECSACVWCSGSACVWCMGRCAVLACGTCMGQCGVWGGVQCLRVVCEELTVERKETVKLAAEKNG